VPSFWASTEEAWDYLIALARELRTALRYEKMTQFWAGLYKHWIWLGLPVMLAAATALWLLIAAVVAVIKKAHIFRAPLAAIREVEFLEAGRVVLSIEGPLLTTRFAGVQFELREMNGGRIDGRPCFFRARTSGFTTARMELMEYNLPRPGRYVLSMMGLGTVVAGDASHAVVFMRPHLLQSMAYVLAIVFASVGFIASLVFFLMRLVGM